MSELPTVTIYTDGACSGNPGPGGWGAILKFGDKEKELNGGERHTTNNQMELMAAISALEAQRLAHRRQEAGEECRAMAAAGRCAQGT